jgi:uncharacterized membrane protein YbhN (UPF0104 family)
VREGGHAGSVLTSQARQGACRREQGQPQVEDHAFSAHPPPPAQLIVGYATGYALSRRALPLGGAGIVEALLTYSLVWLKIALVPALLAVFAYRLINLWLPMVPALAGIPTLRSLQGRRRARTSAA